LINFFFSFVYNLPSVMLAFSIFFVIIFFVFRQKRTINDYQQIQIFNSIFKKYLIVNLVLALTVLRLNIDDILNVPAIYILIFSIITLLSLIFVQFNYFRYNSLTSLRGIKIRSIHFALIVTHLINIILLLLIIFKNQYYI
jgi:hypothetical protein